MNDKGEIILLTYLAVFVSMYIGVVVHYAMIKGTRRTSISLFTYLTMGDKSGSILKLFTILGSAWQFCNEVTGVNNLNLELIWARLMHGAIHVNGVSIIIAAAMAGYTADSLVNNLKTMVSKK